MKRETLGCLMLPLAGILVTPTRSDEATKTVPVLEISLTKSQYVVGEPLIVRLTLANNSAEKIARYFVDDEDFADTDIILTFSQRGKAGAFDTRIAGSGADRAPLALRVPPTIDPGALWQCEKMFVPVYLLDGGYTLVPAGSYRLSAKVFLSGRKPIGISDSSNTVEVTIEEPAGDDEKALALLGPKGMAGFFLGVHGGIPKEIEGLLAAYPRSTYARYAQARLLLDRAKRWQWYASRASSPADRPDLPSFLAQSRAYIRQFPDMPLNDSILLWCARLQHVARDEEGSARTLQELFRDYPQSEVIPTARKHVQDWQRSHKAFQNIRFSSPPKRPASLPESTPDRAGAVLQPGAAVRPRADGGFPLSRPAVTSATWLELTTTRAATRPATQPTTQPAAAAGK